MEQSSEKHSLSAVPSDYKGFFHENFPTKISEGSHLEMTAVL